MRTPDPIDRTDIKILEHLQREGPLFQRGAGRGRQSQSQPLPDADQAHGRNRRHRRLCAQVALEKLGSHVVVFSEITLGSHRPADFRKFEGAARYAEIECYNVSGGDYLLKIVSPGPGCSRN
jgi:DNA-binding Lrp family transcriptional regulator